MGAGASKAAGGMVVTLDALGTLYRFKEPFPVQYTRIAKQYGLKASVEPEDLERSFRRAFKDINNTYPNYGKNKMPSPRVWWEMLVERSFAPVIGTEQLPEGLGSRLYDHFSSGSAYELFPDVQPFLDTINRLRDEYSDPEGPMVMLGVITNSDPRVRQVLNSLGLRVGISNVTRPSLRNISAVADKEASEMVASGRTHVRSPFHDLYNSKNQFDFLTTSYEAGFEKPDLGIFVKAIALSFPLPFSRMEQGMDTTGGVVGNTISLVKGAWVARQRNKTMVRLHIGDDFKKDYKGAKDAQYEALYLARNAADMRGIDIPDGHVVTSLEDAATAVSIMAQEQFR